MFSTSLYSFPNTTKLSVDVVSRIKLHLEKMALGKNREVLVTRLGKGAAVKHLLMIKAKEHADCEIQ